MKASVIGAGPAGLMAAEMMASAGMDVIVYEAKPSPARKFLMAGKSGLNLTLDGDFDKLLAGYGPQAKALRPALEAFDNEAVRTWAEGLGQDVFIGSTGRVFPKSMKASPLLRAWLARLDGLGVTLERRAKCVGLAGSQPIIEQGGVTAELGADVSVLACGGASWARLGSDGAWAEWIETTVTPFAPSNAGVRVEWSDFMSRHFGSALKAVRLMAGDLTSRGEVTLTKTGLEGGGVYTLTPALRDGAALFVDVLPDLSQDEIATRFAKKSNKATLGKWLKQGLKLPPAKVALVQEYAQAQPLSSAEEWAKFLKRIPVKVAGLADIDGAISTSGGVSFDALNTGLMIKDKPGVFCAGEMLDWEAPTGGWLLTACFATGAWAGRHAQAWANKA